MKRLAALLFTAGLMWHGNASRAADPAYPDVAPTVPQVPQPVLTNGEVVAPAAWSNGTANGPRSFRLPTFTGLGKPKAEPWCDNCTPAVRNLPPLPGGLSGGSCAGDNCRGGVAAGHDGSCWDKFKGWLCFRYTPVHLGYTPVPYHPPLYVWFPLHNCTAGHAGGGCSGPGGASGPGAAPLAAGGWRMPGRDTAGGCKPCPTPGEEVLPGYRFANPETKAVALPPPGQSAVSTSSYKVPATGVPYKPTTANPANPFTRP